MTFGVRKDLIHTKNDNLNENMMNSTTLIFRTSVLKNIRRMKKAWQARIFAIYTQLWNSICYV